MTDEAGPAPPPPISGAPMEHPMGEQLRSAVSKILGPYVDQQTEGLSRIATLLSVALMILEPTSLPALTDPRKQDVAQDILRAAVVLIHAHLEEFLRTMARVLLPEADENCLNEIPLMVSVDGKRSSS